MSASPTEKKEDAIIPVNLNPAPTTLSGVPMHAFMVKNVQFVIEKRYIPIKALGRGSSGVVISANDTVLNKKVAIKKIPNIFDDLDRAKRCLREVRLMRSFGQHPNIVPIYDIIEPQGKTFDDLYIVIEYMETDLYKTIYSANTLSDEHLQYFVFQMLYGLEHLHAASVLHRDLKPSNILLNGDCKARICDFGLARGLPEKKDRPAPLTEYVVTRWYRAPEVICSDEYDTKIDVWAIGCIMAEILGRKPLFRGVDYVEQVNLIIGLLGTPSDEDMKFVNNVDAAEYLRSLPVREKVPFTELFPTATPMALDLLSQMLQFNPAKRVTASEALRHPYLRKYMPPGQVTSPYPVPKIDFAFEEGRLTKDMLQELFWHEVSVCKKANPFSSKVLTSSS